MGYLFVYTKLASGRRSAQYELTMSRLDVGAEDAPKQDSGGSLLRLAGIPGTDVFGTIEVYGNGELSFSSSFLSYCLVDRRKVYRSESVPVGWGSVIAILPGGHDRIYLVLTQRKLEAKPADASPFDLLGGSLPRTFLADGVRESDWSRLADGNFDRYWIYVGDSLFYCRQKGGACTWVSWSAEGGPSLGEPVEPLPGRATDQDAVETSNTIEGRGITRRFGREPYPIFQDVSFSIAAGGMYAVTGPSGCGKSTLMRMIEQGGRAARNSVFKYGPLGKNGTLHLPRGFHNAVSAAPQDTETLHREMTVQQELEYYAKLHSRKDVNAAVTEVASDLNLEPALGTTVSHLSGGQLKRLNAAIALLSQPELLFFDEADSGLDAKTAREFYTLVKRRVEKSQGTLTVFCITHSFDCEDLFDGVVLMGTTKGTRKTEPGPGVCYVGPFGESLFDFFGISETNLEWKQELLGRLANNAAEYRNKYMRMLEGR